MNYVFPCASVNGLTLAQKREAVKALRAAIKEEAIIRKAVREDAKAAKIAAKAEKAAARAAKKAAKIAALEAKLTALRNPVGTAAKKAARKPSKVTVTKMVAA
jgi:molybdopterin-biosynthesis enzyme MoeA-like protein